MDLTLGFLNRYRDHGLLVLRLGLGVMFMIHGGRKLLAGPEMWAGVGGALANFGIAFAPTFWGLLAAATEFGGGLLLAIGLLTRPAAAALLGVMIVAATHHLAAGDGFSTASHPIEDGIAFLSLILMGAGRFGLDAKLQCGCAVGPERAASAETGN